MASQSPITTGWITLNTQCNNRCAWCYQLDVITSNPTQMPFEMARQLVDLFAGLDVLSCIFIGGEPTLYKGLDLLVAQAKARGIEEATVVTNGRILANAGIARKLIDAGTDMFSVTIHSARGEIHDQIAGARAWEQTVRGIRNIVDMGANCTLNLVAGKSNIGDIPDSIPWLLDLGVSGITISCAVGVVSDDSFNDSQSIDPREFAKLVTSLKDAPSSVGFLHELPLCLYSRDVFEQLITQGKLGYGCHIGVGNGISVSPEGVTIPCNSLFNLPMIPLFNGNTLAFTPEELLSIWGTDSELLDLRRSANVYRSKHCETCSLWNMCNSGCPLTWVSLEPDAYINRCRPKFPCNPIKKVRR
jgi:radical SAM protein with 4Fe4S-binding SPASM domain